MQTRTLPGLAHFRAALTNQDSLSPSLEPPGLSRPRSRFSWQIGLISLSPRSLLTAPLSYPPSTCDGTMAFSRSPLGADIALPRWSRPPTSLCGLRPSTPSPTPTALVRVALCPFPPRPTCADPLLHGHRTASATALHGSRLYRQHRQCADACLTNRRGHRTPAPHSAPILPPAAWSPAPPPGATLGIVRHHRHHHPL